MEFIKPGISIDFIGKRKIAFVLSVALIVATILLLIWRGGLNLGVDFSGGILIQVKLDKKQTPSNIKDALRELQLEDSIIQEFGEEREFEYLIRVRNPDITSTGLSEKVKQALIVEFGGGVE